MKPYVICVCHQKGGVAKTTTVSGLGAALVEQDLKVLLIDLDPSANLTASLGLNPLHEQYSMADIITGEIQLSKTSLPTKIPDLDIIPSNQEMHFLAQYLGTNGDLEVILKKTILYEELNYDFLIIDSSPTLGVLITSALVAADLAIIPVQPEYFAIQALGGMFKMIQGVRSNYNPGLYYRLLVTMYDLRGNLHTQFVEKMQNYYPDILFETLIGFDSQLRSSQVAGTPITTFATKSRAAGQYRALAKEIYAYVEKRNHVQPS